MRFTKRILVVIPFCLSTLLITPAPNNAATQITAQPAAVASAGINAAHLTYFPAIYNRWPPVPYPPQLSASAVQNAAYTLSWAEQPVRLADTYTLQESVYADFSAEVRTVCTTNGLSCAVTQNRAGTFYYRVRGRNDAGDGEWSAPRAVTVPIHGGVLVNTRSRAASLAYYQSNYLMSSQPAIGWTGSYDPCNPGSTSQAYRDAVLRRYNYFRAMAGVPADVVFTSEYNRYDQAAALIMSKNNALNHTPPTTWECYCEDGRLGASTSNLYLGVNGWTAISGYIKDAGGSNYFAGHRRWILYPQTQTSGTGDVPGDGGHAPANALRAWDDHAFGARPLTREEFVAWPPPGYVPYPVVYARWSLAYPGADFSRAWVTMTRGGAGLAVSTAPLSNGFGENTLVWIPNGMNDGDTFPRPAADTAYQVVVHNVLISGQSRDFSYTVTVFDPGVGAAGALASGVEDAFIPGEPPRIQ